MGLLNAFANKFSKDEDFKRAEKEMKIQRILEQRQKNSNERELERFHEEARQEKIKKDLEEFRKQKQKELFTQTILNQENIFKKKNNLFKEKENIIQIKQKSNGRNLFFK